MQDSLCVKSGGELQVIGAACAEQHGEMGHRRSPRVIAALPFGHNVPQGETEQRARCFIRRGMAARVEDLAELHVIPSFAFVV